MQVDIANQLVQAILLVEDEVLIRFHIADYLRDCGFTVVEAANASEAITMLKSPERIDLVVTDIDMPGPTPMNGIALGRWMREHRPDVALIINSGSLKLAEEAAELCEGSPLLAKPYPEAELLKRIRQILGKGSTTPKMAIGAIVGRGNRPAFAQAVERPRNGVVIASAAACGFAVAGYHRDPGADAFHDRQPPHRRRGQCRSRPSATAVWPPTPCWPMPTRRSTPRKTPVEHLYLPAEFSPREPETRLRWG